MTRQEKIEETIKSLQKELKELKNAEIPIPLSEPDFSPLIILAKGHINGLAKHGTSDDDSDHWFYEAVMECVYGKHVWEWINKNTD